MRYFLRIFSFIFLVIQPVVASTCESPFLQVKYNNNSSQIRVEVADSYGKRKTGLMFRPHLDRDAGMLFIYDSPRRVGFWMKNSQIPLDIAFADHTGRVLRIIHDTEPLSLARIDGGKNIQFVLEINAGMAEELNLFEGSELVHTRINKSLDQPC